MAGKASWAGLSFRAVGPVLLALGISAGCRSGDPTQGPAALAAEKPMAVEGGARSPAAQAPAKEPPAPIAPLPPRKEDGKVSLSPPGDPQGGDKLDTMGREGGLQATEEKALAQHFYEVGKRFYDELEYEKAYDALEKSVRLDPTNQAAVELYRSAGAILGRREDELKAQIERYRAEFDVKVELVRQEMVRFFESGEKAFNAGDYDAAIRDLERVKELIAWYPYKIDTQGHADRAEKLVVEAKRKKREADLKKADEREQEALKRAREEQKQKKQSEERRISTMLEQTSTLLQSRRYEQARALSEEVLKIEPHNAIAKKLHEYAMLGVHMQTEQRLFDDKRDEMWLDDLNERAALTPREKSWVLFPDDWQERVRGRKGGVATEQFEPPAWVKNYEKVLKERKIAELNFPDVPLKDVVIFLQDISGLNFVIGPGIDPEEKKVSVRLKNIVLESALKIIMEQTKLAYIFDKESIIITEPGKGKADVYFDIYDVSDILYKIKDFPGPRLSLPNPDAPGGPAGGGGGGLVFDEGKGGGEGDELSGDTLIDIVKGATGGDEAWGEGTSIEPHRGQLLVTNTREVHARIAEVLENLRHNQGLFVHIETRFITIENDALEDIGVDFRGLGGNPGDERFDAQGNPNPNSSNPFGTPLDMGPPPRGIDPAQRGGIDVGGAKRNFPPSPLGMRDPGFENFVWRTQNIFDGTSGVLKGSRLLGGGGATLLVTFLDPFQVNAIIRAEGQQSKVRRLTAPRVTAANREKVFVSVITQRAYIADWELISGGVPSFVVEVPDPIIQTFQEGVVLEVRPTVSSDRKFVTLDVRPSLATLVGGRINTITVNLGSFSMAGIAVPIGVPEITLEEAFTSVTIPDGGTALLGGFRQVNQSVNEASLPFVDNIPVLNLLFKRRGELRETRSLVILITAKIISIRDEEAKKFNRQK